MSSVLCILYSVFCCVLFGPMNAKGTLGLTYNMYLSIHLSIHYVISVQSCKLTCYVGHSQVFRLHFQLYFQIFGYIFSCLDVLLCISVPVAIVEMSLRTHKCPLLQ